MAPRKRAPSKKKEEADAAAEAMEEVGEAPSPPAEEEAPAAGGGDGDGDADEAAAAPKAKGKRAPAAKKAAAPKRGKKAAAAKEEEKDEEEEEEEEEEEAPKAKAGRKRAPAAKKEPKPPAPKRGRKAAAKKEEEEDEVDEEEAANGEEEAEVEAEPEEKPAAKGKAGVPKGGKLSKGDALPAFELQNEAGEAVKSEDVLAEAGMVIFAYPKANTPGCTKQACGFKDNHADLVAAGYKVFGISADNPKPQSNWKAKHSLPYSLLCDPSKETLKVLGILQGGKIVRSHIVVAKGGEVVDVRYGISPGDSPTEALAACK